MQSPPLHSVVLLKNIADAAENKLQNRFATVQDRRGPLNGNSFNLFAVTKMFDRERFEVSTVSTGDVQTANCSIPISITLRDFRMLEVVHLQTVAQNRISIKAEPLG